MSIFLNFIIFVFGLTISSFLNCVIYRLEKNESFLWGRSYCPHCKHILSWWDLIPVFSFLVLGGKCRYCHQKISYQYPLVEMTTGFLFVLIFQLTVSNQQLTISGLANLLYLFIASCLLLIIFVYDLKYYLIPDKVVYPGIVIAIIYQILANWSLFSIVNLGLAILPAFILLAIILFSHGAWMGLGDFKLAILMGLFLGWPNILFALFSAFFLGAIIGAVLIILKKKGLKSEIPFGPFLVTGTFLALFWGEKVINWYLGFLF